MRVLTLVRKVALASKGVGDFYVDMQGNKAYVPLWSTGLLK